MASSETLPFPPGYECPGCPEVCQNGTLRVTGRVWWVYGGGTEGERWGKGGGPAASSRPSSVPFWHTTPFLFHLSISNRYPNRYPNNPFPPLIRPATTCPTLHAAAPTAPDHRGTQTHVSAIFRLLASSRRLMASFTIRSRSANRFISSDGCCSTPLFMQPQLLLSIPFPRSEPDCSPRL